MKPMKKASRFVFGATTVATAAFFVAAATDQSAVPGLPRQIVQTAWTAVEPILRGSSSPPKLGGISVRGILPKPHAANSAANTSPPIPADAGSAPTLANVTPSATAVVPSATPVPPATAVDPCGGQCVASKSSRPLPDKLTSAPRAATSARQGSPGARDAEIAGSARPEQHRRDPPHRRPTRGSGPPSQQFPHPWLPAPPAWH